MASDAVGDWVAARMSWNFRLEVSVAGWPSRFWLGLFAHWYGAEDMPWLGCEWMGEVEAEAGRKKAHTFRSAEEKRRIVEETLKAEVSVSSVGRALRRRIAPAPSCHDIASCQMSKCHKRHFVHTR